MVRLLATATTARMTRAISASAWAYMNVHVRGGDAHALVTDGISMLNRLYTRAVCFSSSHATV
jgi:hypothetical protein